MGVGVRLGRLIVYVRVDILDCMHFMVAGAVVAYSIATCGYTGVHGSGKHSNVVKCVL